MVNCCISCQIVLHRGYLKLPNSLTSWISAFLANRSQQVAVERVVSQYFPVISRVPQGFVLGLILFILFINDLDILLAGEASFQLFCRRFKLYTSYENSTSFSIQIALNRLQKWSEDWQLRINHSISQHLDLSPACNCPAFILDGKNILLVGTLKDIGFDASCKLTN